MFRNAFGRVDRAWKCQAAFHGVGCIAALEKDIRDQEFPMWPREYFLADILDEWAFPHFYYFGIGGLADDRVGWPVKQIIAWFLQEDRTVQNIGDILEDGRHELIGAVFWECLLCNSVFRGPCGALLHPLSILQPSAIWCFFHWCRCLIILV